MNSRKIVQQAPWLLFLLIGGIAVAQNSATGRVFPYVGHLEENGFAVTGSRDLRVNLFDAADAESACDTQTFEEVEINAGRFQLDLVDVPDRCLHAGELFASLSVAPVGEAFVDLAATTPSGRVRVAAVPFAAAAPKAATFLVESDATIAGTALIGDPEGDNVVVGADDIQASTNGSPAELVLQGAGGGVSMENAGTIRMGESILRFFDGANDFELTGVDPSRNDIGVELRDLSNVGDGNPIFRVLSIGGAERLRVEHSGRTAVANDFDVEGGRYLRDGERVFNTAASGTNRCARFHSTQVCWGQTTFNGFPNGNHTATFARAFVDESYSVTVTVSNGSATGIVAVTRGKGTDNAGFSFVEADNTKVGNDADHVAIGETTLW